MFQTLKDIGSDISFRQARPFSEEMILRIVFKTIEKHYPHSIPQYRKFFSKKYRMPEYYQNDFSIKRKYIPKFIYSTLRIYEKHNYAVDNKNLFPGNSGLKR
ncbi:hypothetical protein LEP1GSC043_0573 [Leptospira weilii str. Ecochallenge]|uniref:Uncharacterized protein n=1 Tax=Leptospira weilii str. Ecochallenge TaxID=1049986 RepID=N1U8L1_9LEPT|nr:hypothetical protein LEP1GSC043_0573 [Leptospira weilii str. Ecochallenge]